MKVPTIHNAAHDGDIAESILLPGDPLRAKFIADHYLQEVRQYNAIRGMYGFTGIYKGVPLSVQGTGMGGPSMGIYSYELIHAYGVKKLIRIGSAGTLQDSIEIGKLIGVTAASYDANISQAFGLRGTFSPSASFELLSTCNVLAQEKHINITFGPVLSSDMFYLPVDAQELTVWKHIGMLAVEMECASLYAQALSGGAQALTILTVTDQCFGTEAMSADERERSLHTMISLALETAIA